jgi:hypothetical protein
MAIVKILSRHTPSYGSLIRYILNEEKIDRDHVYTNNLRSNTVEGYAREFMENEAFRRQSRSDSVLMYHEILSFQAENSPLTKPMLDELIRKYMELRGPTSVSVGAIHFDKENTVHAHFAVSGLHYRTGKSFGLSKAQLHDLKMRFQEYHRQKYPELARSLPEHGKGARYKGHAQWHAHNREEIVEKVRELFPKSATQQAFLEGLRDAGFHHYERNSKPTGIEYEGQRFRFSRLLEGKRLDELPVDRSEEEKALAEIRAIRERLSDREPGRDDWEPER